MLLVAALLLPQRQPEMSLVGDGCVCKFSSHSEPVFQMIGRSRDVGRYRTIALPCESNSITLQTNTHICKPRRSRSPIGLHSESEDSLGYMRLCLTQRKWSWCQCSNIPGQSQGAQASPQHSWLSQAALLHAMAWAYSLSL